MAEFIPRRKFDLSNLKIDKKEPTQVETTETVSTPDVDFNSTETLTNTGKEFSEQISTSEQGTEEVVPQPFKIQPKNEGNIDSEKVQRFIEHSKGLNKSIEDTEQAYIKGLRQGIFDKKAEQESPSVKEDGGFFNNLIGEVGRIGTGFKKGAQPFVDVGSDIKSGLRKFGADIQKAERGAFAEQATGKTPEETQKSGEFGLLGKVISSGIEREKEFGERKTAQGETGATGIEKGFEVFGEGAGIVKDVIGETITSILTTIAPEDLENDVKEIIKKVASTDNAQQAAKIFADLKLGFEEFERQNPRLGSISRTFGNLIAVGSEFFGGSGVKKGVKRTAQEVETLAENAIDAGKKGFEKGKEIGSDIIQTGQKEFEQGKDIINQFIDQTAEGKKLQEEIQAIKNFGAKIEDKTFANKQAEKLIADTNSMLPTDKEAFKQISGKDYQTWLNERGLRGTGAENIDLLAKKFVKERDAIDNALEKIPGKHNPKSLAPIMDEILEFAKATENIENIKFIEGVQKGIDATGGASAKDIRKIKQIYERENKFAYVKDADSVKTNRATNRDTALREDLITIANDFGLDLKDVSKELQQTVAVMNGIGKKLGRQTDGNIFDISDRIIGPLGFAEPSILLGLGAKKFLSSDAIKSATAKILGNESIEIPTLKEPRLRQKIKEFEQMQKDLKKSTKKEAKQKELDRIKQEIQDLVTPSSQKKLPEGQRVTPQTVDKGIIQESKEDLKNLNK